MALASIFVLAGLERRAWKGLAALPLVRPMLAAVELRLGVVRPGPCTTLLVVPSTETATTSCTWGGRARKRACRRPWVRARTQALDTAVFVTGLVITACLSLGLAEVPLVAASTDTDTATLPTDTDSTAEACTARDAEREAGVCSEELVGLGNMALVTTFTTEK